MMAAALSTRNAHSGPRERTRPPLEPSPPLSGALPDLPCARKPLTVQHKIVEALQPTPERRAASLRRRACCSTTCSPSRRTPATCTPERPREQQVAEPGLCVGPGVRGNVVGRRYAGRERS